MRQSVLILALAFAAPGASPNDAKPAEGHFTLTVTGSLLASFSGAGPLSYARRRSAVRGSGERLEIKLRAESAFGKLDFDAAPDVTGKPPLSETGRYDLGNLGAIGTITLGKQRSWINAKTGGLIVEESDERHVKGHLDFKGPCKTGPEQGICSVHADFDVLRQN